MDIVKGQPLTLPDGTVILPEPDSSGSKVITVTEQQERENNALIEQELGDLLEDPFENEHAASYKRTLADINVPFKQMNLFMLVTSYSMWGLDAYAISRVLDTSVENVQRLMQSHMYTELRQQIVEAIRYAETASVHGYLAHKAQAAAKVVTSLLTNPSGDLKLAAAKDILDRSGFRPADRVEHVHKFEDELRIVHLQDTNITTIDVDVVTDG